MTVVVWSWNLWRWMSPPNVRFMCAGLLLESHSSTVKFVAFCFALWDGKGAGSLGLVLTEEGRWMRRSGEGRKKRLKVVKTWHQSNFFQLDMFWQLTGEASHYEEIKGKNLFLSHKMQVSETIWRTQRFEIISKNLSVIAVVWHRGRTYDRLLTKGTSFFWLFFAPSFPPSFPSDRNACPGLGFGR